MQYPSRDRLKETSALSNPVQSPARAQASSSQSFRPDIEGLRGIAVLLVVAFHTRVPGFTGGFIGVDVFFVLSGYLITSLLVKEIERTGRLDVVQFYARRARRLLPASALVLLSTILVSRFVFSPLEQEEFTRTARATALYLSNIWFLRNAGDYFAAAVETNPLLHTWSLAVEEQFYLVWPALLLLAMRGRQPRLRLALVMAAVIVVSLTSSVWLTWVNRPWAFYSSPVRAWEFAVGGLICLLPSAVMAAKQRLPVLIGWSGLAAIILGAVAFTESTSFPGVAAILPVAGTAAVLAAGSARGGGLQRLLNTAPLQHLRRLSYSWYLWHWPVLVLGAVLIPSMSLFGRLACALLSLGLSITTYVAVENPVRFHRLLVPRPAFSLGLAVLLTGAGYSGSNVMNGIAHSDSLSPEQLPYTSAAEDRGADYLGGGMCQYWRVGTQPEECYFGEQASGTTVVLLGDSHAAQWLVPLERISRDRGWRLVAILKSACPAASVPVFNFDLQREFYECTRWREAALRRVIQLRPAAVILGSAAFGYVAHTPMPLTARQWTAGQRRSVAVLDSAGIHTLVLHDTPRPGFDVPTCLARAAASNRALRSACVMDRANALDSRVLRSDLAALRGLRHATLVDLSEQFCDAASCRPIIDGVVVYRDDHHITATFAARLTSELASLIVPLVPTAHSPGPYSIPTNQARAVRGDGNALLHTAPRASRP